MDLAQKILKSWSQIGITQISAATIPTNYGISQLRIILQNVGFIFPMLTADRNKMFSILNAFDTFITPHLDPSKTENVGILRLEGHTDQKIKLIKQIQLYNQINFPPDMNIMTVAKVVSGYMSTPTFISEYAFIKYDREQNSNELNNNVDTFTKQCMMRWFEIIEKIIQFYVNIAEKDRTIFPRQTVFISTGFLGYSSVMTALVLQTTNGDPYVAAMALAKQTNPLPEHIFHNRRTIFSLQDDQGLEDMYKSTLIISGNFSRGGQFRRRSGWKSPVAIVTFLGLLAVIILGTLKATGVLRGKTNLARTTFSPANDAQMVISNRSVESFVLPPVEQPTSEQLAIVISSAVNVTLATVTSESYSLHVQQLSNVSASINTISGLKSRSLLAIIGITIILLLVITIVPFCVYRRRKKQQLVEDYSATSKSPSKNFRQSLNKSLTPSSPD
ncbi:unnamed protein product [Didymodactylos carnosus]|uniref:Uncharacterized protein n=1 Tax=Didymodactylos carnosus TaxID=1234261 RepID=A0A814FXN0_9BILA|nr:unnamed protein product [Didymodactylos carnosus]CAF0986254.1 unnamed protein product [Didymodactylos carnosus]CAF3670012.1 unnamed protein product [Didymodactylos carnosus]CAF3758525.1 unnamed protein product [Didymodactylos carnosus]